MILSHQFIKQLSFSLSIIALLVLVGCNEGNPVIQGPVEGPAGVDPQNQYAELRVRMHDTTGPYSQVNVEIVEASMHVEDSSSSGWYPLNINAGVYNLLVLQNGIDTVLANSTQLETGYATQLRLVLGDSNWVVMNDSVTEHPLSTPSAQQSGIKINIHDTMQPNTQYDLILDFDVNQSIIVTGNQMYKLKPVIKVDSLVEI